MSIWQLRNALEEEGIVPVFALQHDSDILTNTYKGIVDELDTVRAKVQAFNTLVSEENRNSFSELLNRTISTVTNNLIDVIQTAHNVSTSNPNWVYDKQLKF